MNIADLSFEDYQEEYIRRRARIRPASSFLRGDAPQPPPLVEGLLRQRTLNIFIGEPYTSKSLLSLHLALALATGRPLFNQFAVSPCSVLFVGQDAPTWDYAEQVRRIARGMSITEGDLAHSLDFWTNEGIDLRDRDFRKTLSEWHDVNPFELLILDTLSQIQGADENNTREMGGVMAILKDIRDRLNTAILVIHHISKPSHDNPRSELYQARGSSTVVGSVDAVYTLKRTSNGVRFNAPKNRGMSKGAFPLLYTIEETPDPVALILKATSATPPDIKAQLVLLIRTSVVQPIHTQHLAINLPNVSRSALFAALKELRDAGTIISPTRGYWRLP